MAVRRLDGVGIPGAYDRRVADKLPVVVAQELSTQELNEVHLAERAILLQDKRLQVQEPPPLQQRFDPSASFWQRAAQYIKHLIAPAAKFESGHLAHAHHPGRPSVGQAQVQAHHRRRMDPRQLGLQGDVLFRPNGFTPDDEVREITIC